MPDCGTEKSTGISAGNLTYGVIELGSNHLTHATLASAIGQTLGLAPFSSDPYDIMGAGVYAGEFGAHPTYGPAGPRASSDTLVTLGWLDPGQIAQPEGSIGDPVTSGFVTLGPLTQAGNPDLPVRAEIGPYSFEFRIQSDAQRWDQGLPQAAAVIARSDDGETVLVNVGGSVTWGGPPARLGRYRRWRCDGERDRSPLRVCRARVCVAYGAPLHRRRTMGRRHAVYVLPWPPRAATARRSVWRDARCCSSDL